MSVESARAAIWQRDCVDDFDLDADLDRLILEVQAAMPCYLVWDTKFMPEPATETDCLRTGEPCPSCTARQQLEALKATVVE